MAGNQGYSNSEIMAMQQDAVRRVKEMQRRSKETVSRPQQRQNNHEPQSRQRSTSQSPQSGQNNKSQNNNTQKRQNTRPEHRGTPHRNEEKPPLVPEVSSDGMMTTIEKLLKTMNRDSDRILLIGLIILLLNEGGDQTAILALFYIFL